GGAGGARAQQRRRGEGDRADRYGRGTRAGGGHPRGGRSATLFRSDGRPPTLSDPDRRRYLARRSERSITRPSSAASSAQPPGDTVGTTTGQSVSFVLLHPEGQQPSAFTQGVIGEQLEGPPMH